VSPVLNIVLQFFQAETRRPEDVFREPEAKRSSGENLIHIK
jgi:hypothetical protein